MLRGKVIISARSFNNEYLYATQHDDGRGGRFIHTWMDGGDAVADPQADWTITPVGDHFFITNGCFLDEYLYACEESDGHQRRSLRTQSGSPAADPRAHWIITPIGDYYAILNKHFQSEYLYATRHDDGGSRRYVHTWMGGGEPAADQQAHWVIKPLAIALETSQSKKEDKKSPTAIDYFPILPSLPALVDGAVPLRIMSFNIWCNGGTSLTRTFDCIRLLQPDVVCLQEASSKTVASAAQTLGWYFSVEAALLSRFPICNPYRGGTWTAGKGADFAALHIPLHSRGFFRVLVANCHLCHHPYGPYLLRGERRSMEEAVQSEQKFQIPPLRQVLREMRGCAKSSDGAEDPCILCGDFNAASHLDYIETGVPWPTSLLCEDVGMVDTYALANPEHLGAWKQQRFDAPGITWSCLPMEEPHSIYDRIDFIYASESRLVRVIRSVTVDETTPGCNPWPSDHRAVLTDLLLRLD